MRNPDANLPYKMTTRSEPAEGPRPSLIYKQELLSRILQLAPQSLLDVGCGDGELLRSVTAEGCQTSVGIEPDEALVMQLRGAGMDVHVGSADTLAFEDRSFDAVVLSYVAHHLEHLTQALLEAARVARRSVLVLEPWYDITVPSQQVALEFDNWFKTIDRRRGFVHAPCVGALELASTFLASGFSVEYSYHLLLQPMSIGKLEARAREQLSAIGGNAHLERQLDGLLDRARLLGCTEDGALHFRASRRTY